MLRQRIERREAWACSRRGAGLPLRPLTGGRVVASSTPAQRPAPSRAERGRRNAPLRGREELVGMEPRPTARRVAKGRHYLGVRRRKPEGLGEGVEEGESGEEALAEAAPTPPRSAWRGATGEEARPKGAAASCRGPLGLGGRDGLHSRLCYHGLGGFQRFFRTAGVPRIPERAALDARLSRSWPRSAREQAEKPAPECDPAACSRRHLRASAPWPFPRSAACLRIAAIA